MLTLAHTVYYMTDHKNAHGYVMVRSVVDTLSAFGA